MRGLRLSFGLHLLLKPALFVAVATFGPMQLAHAQTIEQPAASQASATPPGMQSAAPPAINAGRNEGGEPLSARAAAAAERASRALAKEDGSDFEGVATVETDPIMAEQPAITAVGQTVTPDQRRQTSAAAGSTARGNSAPKSSTTCIAGCY